jgi:hypothetical protein
VDAEEYLARAGVARAWLTELAALGPAPDGIPVPGAGEARELMAELGFAPADAREVLAAPPDPDAAPALWWLLQREYHQLLAGMDSTLTTPPWRQLPASFGAAGAHLYSWLFLAALPAARANHARRGVPDGVSRATLGDFARQADLCRRLYGHGGVAAPNWLALHFRGTLFELGRLQIQRSLVPRDKALPIVPDAAADVPMLDLHIPESGPLAPDLVDGSLDAARAFFPRHFPHERYELAVCTSWLLDDQLAGYLPETSNIVAFQRRFRLTPPEPGNEDDRSVVEFVFRRPREHPLGEAELAALPQDTTLRRAIVSHLRAGGHWRWRTGWFRL